METTRFKIPKLVPADVAPVAKAVEAVPQVASVAVSATDNEVVVEHDGADTDALKIAIQKIGYVAVEG